MQRVQPLEVMEAGAFGVPRSPGSESFDQDAEIAIEEQLRAEADLFGEGGGRSAPPSDEEDE